MTGEPRLELEFVLQTRWECPKKAASKKTRGTFDHRMRNFLLFVFVSRNIC